MKEPRPIYSDKRVNVEFTPENPMGFFTGQKQELYGPPYDPPKAKEYRDKADLAQDRFLATTPGTLKSFVARKYWDVTDNKAYKVEEAEKNQHTKEYQKIIEREKSRGDDRER